MAVAKLRSGGIRPVSHDMALVMWKHIAGEQTAPAQLIPAIEKIERLYLNIKDKDVPRSYLERYHSDMVAPAVQVAWWQK